MQDTTVQYNSSVHTDEHLHAHEALYVYTSIRYAGS